jgi:hypothetical protein
LHIRQSLLQHFMSFFNIFFLDKKVKI